MMNQGAYQGTGTMYVCEKITNGQKDVSRVCTSPGCSGSNCYEADSGQIAYTGYEAAYAGNNSQYTHTVWGYFEWDWGAGQSDAASSGSTSGGFVPPPKTFTGASDSTGSVTIENVTPAPN